MGYRANERGKLSEDFVAAGDGLVAFGAALILPVQTHCRTGRPTAGQWIYAKQSHPLMDQKADKQGHQIQYRNAQLVAQPREETWGLPLPYQRG